MAGTGWALAEIMNNWPPFRCLNRLSCFAAGADAVIHGEIIADHLDLAERRRAVADQGRILHWRDDLAVLDKIGLGALEYKIAGGDIDLAAAKIYCVNSFIYATNNRFWIVLAWQ